MSAGTNGWKGRSVAVVIGIVVCVSLALVLMMAGPPVRLATLGSTTMSPRWEEGERIWVLRWPRWGWAPERGDVVVFPAPPSTGERQGESFIKRVAGLPGEEVAVRGGVLHVNQQAVEEPWRNTTHGAGPDQDPIDVPSGQVFLLGDDRGRSYDSRSWGLLDIDRIDGVVMTSGL